MADTFNTEDVEEIVRRLKEEAAAEPASEQHQAAVKAGSTETRTVDRGPVGNFAEDIGGLAAGIITKVRGSDQGNSLEEFDRAIGSSMAQVSSMPNGPERQFAMQNVMRAVATREKLAKMKGNIIRYMDQSGLPETKKIRGIIQKMGAGKDLSPAEWHTVARVAIAAEGNESVLAEAMKGDSDAQKSLGKTLQKKFRGAISNLRYGGVVGGIAEPELPKSITEQIPVEGSVEGAIGAARAEKDVERKGKTLDIEGKALANIKAIKDIQAPPEDKRPPLAQTVKDAVAFKRGLLDQAKNIAEAFNLDAIGPMAGRWEEFAGKYWSGNQTLQSFQAATEALRAILINERAKGSLTKNEEELYKVLTGGTKDPPALFKARFLGAVDRISNELENVISVEEEAGVKGIEEVAKGARQKIKTTKEATGNRGSAEEEEEEDPRDAILR